MAYLLFSPDGFNCDKECILVAAGEIIRNSFGNLFNDKNPIKNDFYYSVFPNVCIPTLHCI